FLCFSPAHKYPGKHSDGLPFPSFLSTAYSLTGWSSPHLRGPKFPQSNFSYIFQPFRSQMIFPCFRETILLLYYSMVFVTKKCSRSILFKCKKKEEKSRLIFDIISSDMFSD